MDDGAESPRSGHLLKRTSQHNEAKEDQQKSKQAMTRKWWKMSRHEKVKKSEEMPLSNNVEYCEVLDVNVVDGIRTVKSTSDSMNFPLKFSVNKKPSLDPLDVNSVKKHEKKKKRKEKKSEKSGKCKSASTQSPRSQNQRSEKPRDAVSPTDSEFWGFSNARSPLNFNVEHKLDTETIVNRPLVKSPTASDDEYEAEMAYRFPFLYKRLSVLQPHTNSCDFGDRERPTPRPKSPRQTSENYNDDTRKTSTVKSPDVVCNRRDAYVVDKNRSTTKFTCSQGSVKQGDAHLIDRLEHMVSISHSIPDKVKNTRSTSHSDTTGSDIQIANKDKNMAIFSQSHVQESDGHMKDQVKNKPTDEKRKSRRVQFSDELSSDIDRLLEELDDIW